MISFRVFFRLFSKPSKVKQNPLALSPKTTLIFPSNTAFSQAVPTPVREEFLSSQPITHSDLESIDIGLGSHHSPNNFSDKVAYSLVKTLRKPADLFFGKRYVHRALLLETVAAVISYFNFRFQE
jgi:hypothetical protein